MTTYDVLRAVRDLEEGKVFPTPDTVAIRLDAPRHEIHPLMIEARVQGFLVRHYSRTAKFGGRDGYYLTLAGRAYVANETSIREAGIDPGYEAMWASK